MFKLIYVREHEAPRPNHYRLLAFFNLTHAQNLGWDDADYSVVDAFIQAVRDEGDDVLELTQSSLKGILLERS